jgi:catechol 2,3-dioxygenase-like lactoylglutathione lyase family enzyme
MTAYWNAAFVTLASRDAEQLIHFYSQLLGQQPTVYIPDRYAEFELPGLRLSIFRPRAEDQPEFVARSSSSISLCLETADLEGAIAHLTELGYPPTGEIITASHGKEIYAYDPGGHRLILHQPFQGTTCSS